MPHPSLRRDFVQRNPQNSGAIRPRRKKFNTFKFPNVFSKKEASSKPRFIRNTQAEIVAEKRSFLHIGYAAVSLFLLYLVATTVYPSQIKDVLVPNGFVIILVLSYSLLFFTFQFILVNSFRSMLLAIFLTLQLFFVLQNVEMQLSLILPLLLIFVIIDMLYNKKYKA